MELGLQGIGLYWCIIESLYENNGYLTIDDIKLLSYELRVEEKLIINLIENYDLFKKNKNKFYSLSVLQRLEKITDKANKNRENILKRWSKSKEKDSFDGNTNSIPEKYENDTTVLQTNYYIKEKKKKENKRNNNIIITTTINNNIYSYIEENFVKTISPLEYEKINFWLEEFNEDILKHAINIAVMNRITNFAYVEGILKNWKSKGFKNIEQILEEEDKNNLTKYSSQHELSEEQLLSLKELNNYDWLNDETNISYDK